MTTAAHNSAVYRTVVLLRSSEKKRLQKLAREAKVSSSEIIRRSIHAYEASITKTEQEEFQAAIGEMNRALDAALKSVRSARGEVSENIAKMRAYRKAAHDVQQ